ncbi:MAG: hypothetical protein QFE16_12295 [Pseudomonadota bacterium]|nr:hypothetical protein [Pseudomonadota bacterium]
MRKTVRLVITAAVACLFVGAIAHGGPSALGVGIGITWSPDFMGNGSAGAMLELSNNVTMPGVASIAGNGSAVSPAASLILTPNALAVSLQGNARTAAGDTTQMRWASSTGAIKWSMGNDSLTNHTHDFWLYDNTNSQYTLWAVPGGTSLLDFGISHGGLQYVNASHALTLLTNNVVRLTLTDTLLTAATASQFNAVATFESGTCVIAAAGITCGGVLMTPAADITAVNAASPLSGGGLSGSVSLGLTNCAANQTWTMNAGGTAWVCVTPAGAGITNSASANYYALSNGTNLVNGNTKDDGTNWTINTVAGGAIAKVTVVEASGNTSIAGTLDAIGAITENAVRVVSVAGTGLSKAAATLTLNMAGATCGAGQYMTALGATGTGTCSGTAISGTLNTVAKFTAANTIGNSSITDTGTAVTIGIGGDTLTLNGSATFNAAVQISGAHVNYKGRTNTLSCGVGATQIAGSGDERGGVAFSTGSTTCNITFVNGYSTNPPFCVANLNAAGDVWVSAVTTSSVTFTMSASKSTGDKLYYHCDGGI